MSGPGGGEPSSAAFRPSPPEADRHRAEPKGGCGARDRVHVQGEQRPGAATGPAGGLLDPAD